MWDAEPLNKLRIRSLCAVYEAIHPVLYTVFPTPCPTRNTGSLHGTTFHNCLYLPNSTYTYTHVLSSQQLSLVLFDIYAIPMTYSALQLLNTIPKSLAVGIASLVASADWKELDARITILL